MKQLSLFPGAPATTILGYGTPGLMRLSSTAERVAMLECTFDAGIRHFDTAPSYGYGEAERVLGDFLRHRRDQVTVTTKFGISAPAIIKARWANLLARRILKTVPALRGAVSKKAQKLSQKSVFTPDAARKSLDDSLMALKTDYVDLFLLHEPAYADAAGEELQQFLDDEVRRGRIRAFGCAGDFGVIQPAAAAKLATARWLQFEDNALSRRVGGTQTSGAHCITYGWLKGALPALTDWLNSVPERTAEWERQLGVDCHSVAGLAALLQADSHARNPDGIVLFSTHRADRIVSAAQTASGRTFAPEQLLTFGELVKEVPVSLSNS